MKTLRRIAVASLFPALLALAGAGPRPDPEALLRAGASAYVEGDYARAAERFEEAERYTTEPRRVAFDLASAKYRLALEGGAESARLFREAEQLYRCCLQQDDPRRAEALYGLGNCLLQRNEGEALREAVTAYQECLAEPGAGGRLAADVRYNLEHARLRLAQFDPSRERKAPQDPPPRQGERPPEHRPPEGGRRPEGPDGPGGQEKPGERRPGAKPEPGENARKMEGNPEPGAGQLPPVPDTAEAMPLSPRDAAEHLRRATRLIIEERRAYRAGQVKPPPPEVRDW